MPARRLKDAHIVAAAAALIVVLAGAAAFIGPQDAPGSDGASSLSAGTGGAKAAFLTLKALGYRVERSYEPMTAIAAEPSRTALVITGAQRPSELDRQAMEQFLNAGGWALLVGAQGAAFLGIEGTSLPLPFAEPSTRRVSEPSPLAAGVPEITMVSVTGAPTFGPSYVRVFSDGPDVPLVATARIGKGRVTWLAAPTPVANAHIAGAANLQLLLNVVGEPGERDVLWDEHYHGHTRSLWSYAARTPLPWIGVQLGLVMAAVFATYSRRRGPVRPLTGDQRTSPLEFIDMLRALYQRANASTAAVSAARSRLQRALSSVYGVPAGSSDGAVARILAAKTGTDLKDAAGILDAAARAAGDSKIPPAAAVKLTRDLQRLTDLVERRPVGRDVHQRPRPSFV